jgi:hypothetical protein
MKKNLLILVLLSGIVTSCDLFTTRSPEEPAGTSSGVVSAYDPETLFENMQSALEDGIVENYMACFVDDSYLNVDYVFTPASGAITNYPNLNNWNLQAEKEYFNDLISKLKSGTDISFDYTITQKDYNQVYYEYVVDYTISFQSSSLSGDYQGTSRFKIYKDSRSQCVIVEWQDIKKDNYDSWSDLKGRVYY